MKRMVLSFFLLLVTAPIAAQTVAGDRFRLNDGPCTARSGTGSPETVVVGNICDTWLRSDGIGGYFIKVSGSNTNTGWLQVSTTITTPLALNLTLAPTGDLITAPVGNDIFPGTPYTVNIGSLQNKYLTLFAAELWVETLVAQNTIATIGGRVLVAPTNILTLDLAAAATTITVKYNNFFNGDRIYMEANARVEFMSVTSGASGTGPYTYSVMRDLDGTGANDWAAGDAILDTGQVGNGFIDLYSTAGILSNGSGPAIVGNVRTGTAYNAYAPRWAIGNLNGLYGYASSIYGFAAGNPAATNITADDTNGFRIRSGVTNKFLADVAGNLSIVGDLTVGTNGAIHTAGATSYNTGVGFWLSGGSPAVWRVGDPSGSEITWDGMTLSVIGSAGGIPAGGAADDVNNHSTIIAAGKITVSAGTTFGSGYDPTGKIATAGAAADVNANVTTISGGKITALSITAGQIAANTITAAKITAGTITATEIAAGTITATQIAAGAITAAKLSVGSLSSITSDLGSITAGSINIGAGAFTVSGGGTMFVDRMGSNNFSAVTGSIANFSSNGVSANQVTTGGLRAIDLSGGGNRLVCTDNNGIFYGSAGGSC